MERLIPHNHPCVLDEDRTEVDAVLASGWIAQGPVVAALEADFVAAYGGGGACAVSSGTAALILAIRALGGKRGTVVAVPTYSCSALLNAVFMAGATPRPVDVRSDSFCIDPASLAANAADASIVIAVHTYGAAADVRSLQAGGRAVIEDCCQSLGGSVDGALLGSLGAAAVFSFYATKIITGGQGGLVWSQSAQALASVRDYREFDGRETYEPRFNVQLTDIQAGLVRSQLSRLKNIQKRREDIARRYASVLPQGVRMQPGITTAGRMAYRFVVIAPDAGTRDRLRAWMAAADIRCIVPAEGFELLHRYLKLSAEAFANAERLAETTLSLPLYPALSDADVDRVCEALQSFRA